MDIIVEGIGKKYYTPDEVEISLEFYTKAESYDGALEQGTRDVEIFINDVLETMNFNKEIMKTRSFRVYEETRYDYDRKKEIHLGFAYTQQATLKFDYSMSMIAEFMDRVSKLKNAPKYHLAFNVKDMKQCKEEALAEAYNNAKEKAEAIAKTAGKELKECAKTDFRPFEERVVSRSSLNSKDLFMQEDMAMEGVPYIRKRTGIQDTIQTIFTPEDVEIAETLYCLWITD